MNHETHKTKRRNQQNKNTLKTEIGENDRFLYPIDLDHFSSGEHMSVEVVMPQMGESITEGTVSKWLKAVGDKIEKDEPILEISTDKVDAEVPSPGAGVLLEIRHQEGETVEVGTVVAVIGREGEDAAPHEPHRWMDSESQAAETSQFPAQPAPVAPEAPEPDILTQVASASDEATAGQTERSPSQGNSTLQAAGAAPRSGGATEVVMPQIGESTTEGTV